MKKNFMSLAISCCALFALCTPAFCADKPVPHHFNNTNPPLNAPAPNYNAPNNPGQFNVFKPKVASNQQSKTKFKKKNGGIFNAKNNQNKHKTAYKHKHGGKYTAYQNGHNYQHKPPVNNNKFRYL